MAWIEITQSYLMLCGVQRFGDPNCVFARNMACSCCYSYNLCNLIFVICAWPTSHDCFKLSVFFGLTICHNDSAASTFLMDGSWGRPMDASDCWRWLMMVSSRRSGWSTYPAQISNPHLRNKPPPKKGQGGVGWPAMIQVLLFFLLERRGGLFQQFLNSLI